MKLWIFDLDGTLTDSFPVFFRSMKEIFASHGKQISPELLHEALGTTMPEFFAQHLGTEHVSGSLERLRELSIKYVNEVKPFPGIEPCLEALHKSGRELAVWTARDRDSTEQVLRASGIGRRVQHIVTGCCVARAKPDPEGAQKVLRHFRRGCEEAVMVGDHHHDVNAALQAGLTGVRASWNPYWPREQCPVAHHQFFTVPEFAAWMRERLG